MSSHIDSRAHKPRGGLAFITLLMIIGLTPLQIGALSISGLKTGDLIIPMLFGLTIVDLAVTTKNPGLFLPARGNLHTVFLAVFMFVILVAFTRNPLLPSSLVQGSEGGFKFYWGFLCSFLLYFMIMYWAGRNSIQPTQLMVVLFYVVTGITVIGVFMLVTGMKVPGLETHAWNVQETRGVGGAAGSLRVPFLEVYGQIGFFLALTSIGCKDKLRLIMLAYFIFCVFIGGGRATMLTSIAGAIIWLFLNRKYLVTFLLLLGFGMSLIFVQLLHEIAPTPQLKRLTNIGSLEETSEGRYITFNYLLDEFLEHPLVGTGYGKEYDLPFIRSGRNFLDPERLEQQLRLGSHNTHLQILKNLGLAGYIPFILIWLYPLYKLLPVAMARAGEYPGTLSRDAQICIIFIATTLIRMIVTGNGSESRLYIFAAIITCVISQAVMRNAGTDALMKGRYEHSVS